MIDIARHFVPAAAIAEFLPPGFRFFTADALLPGPIN
jgi:hypothetical protein